jgi:cytochrome c-type biogenesis protein CcmE
MAQAELSRSWEKPHDSSAARQAALAPKTRGRWKFLVGGGLILAAVAYLLITGTLTGARYFITVDELLNNPAKYDGQSVRVTGAVLGETITYDEENLIITFTVAHMPEVNDNLGMAIREATLDPTRTRMAVRVENQVKPELLQNEAQAIMTGTMGEDGVFVVSELNLKCPSRFVEGQVDQSIGQ